MLRIIAPLQLNRVAAPAINIAGLYGYVGNNGDPTEA
jgi:hypothetical protein